MLPVDEAQAILLDAVAPLPVETVALVGALGRVLARDVEADRDFPPTDRSAMDGFAVRSADCARPGAVLRAAGEIRAGQDPAGVRVEPGSAVRIMTGGIVPAGADAVVMIELIEDRGDGTVRIAEAVEPGQHVRRRAEDLRAGEPVAPSGAVLGAAEIAALAAVGSDPVAVVGRPTVAVLSTGDEIVDPGRTPGLHQVRNSNARALCAQLASMGIRSTDLGIAGDEPARLDAALARGFEHDLLLVTGGVSMGDYDLVGPRLTAAGAATLFHKVAMKPGKPILAARRDRCTVLGLPGNPVSAFVGFVLFAAPWIRAAEGRRDVRPPIVRARLERPLRRRPGRTGYHLARLDPSRRSVTPIRTAGSGDVLSLVRANAFAVAPAGKRSIPAGEDVDVVAWGDAFGDVPGRPAGSISPPVPRGPDDESTGTAS